MTVRRGLVASLGVIVASRVLLPPFASAADELAEAAAFIRSAGDRLTGLVQETAPAGEKHRRLRDFLGEVADVDGVARFCLGRFWRAATAAQQQEYLRLFRDVLTNSVAARVSDYPQGRSQVSFAAPIRNGETIEVPTLVKNPTRDTQARVVWVLSGETGRLRIIDVVAEGMSLRLTQRSDYAAFLSKNNNDINALLQALRQQAGDG